MRLWRNEGLSATYGDISDPEFIGTLPLQGVKWVISTIPDHDISLTHEDPRLALVRGLEEANYKGKTAIAANSRSAIERLETVDIDVILNPYRDAAEEAVEFVCDNRKPQDIEVIDPEAQEELGK